MRYKQQENWMLVIMVINNEIFTFKESKRDCNGNIIEFTGTYFEYGFQSTNPLQLPTISKLTLTKL